jgi:uncharacterized protein
VSGFRERYGPYAVIAGASEGIGAAFARALARRGLSLILIARRVEPLEALAAELRAVTTVETVALDLGDESLPARLTALTQEIGLVVYNAALSTIAPFLEVPLPEKLEAIDVNARGPLVFAHVLGERMAARGRGGIVLLSSLTAFWGSAYLATYGATKAFNLSLGEALAIELGARGVDVVVSCAGATKTPGFLASVAGRKAPRSMSADAVAEESLAALPRRGAFVPGAFNRFAQWVLARLFPRRAAVRIMASQTRALLSPRNPS